MTAPIDRRRYLNTTLLGATALAAGLGLEEKILMAGVDGGPGASPPAPPAIAPGSLPCGKIGKISLSRLFLGSNLISGWAHARDLMYVSPLIKAYNNEPKVLQTLEIAERCGINTIIDPGMDGIVERYNRRHGGKMQTLICLGLEDNKAKMRDQIRSLVDHGATLIYSHGEATDRFVRDGRLDVLAMGLDLIHEQGVPAGIGGHSLETPIACEKNKLNADFYVKTFHMDTYWSATPKEHRTEWCWYEPSSGDHEGFRDNIWCVDADRTAAFMESVSKPWIAFKVMAAGAIPPRQAFAHAFRHGADFVVAGMFDFQIEDDVKIAINALRHSDGRKRPWHG
jgi:hypothetical protein